MTHHDHGRRSPAASAARQSTRWVRHHAHLMGSNRTRLSDGDGRLGGHRSGLGGGSPLRRAPDAFTAQMGGHRPSLASLGHRLLVRRSAGESDFTGRRGDINPLAKPPLVTACRHCIGPGSLGNFPRDFGCRFAGNSIVVWREFALPFLRNSNCRFCGFLIVVFAEFKLSLT